MRAGVLSLFALLIVGFTGACGDDPATPSGSASSGTGGHGGGNTGGGGSSSSSTGTGGETAVHNTTEFVNAGGVMQSPGYKMVYTLGQPTQNQGKTTSPSYRMQGGVIGANGSLP